MPRDFSQPSHCQSHDWYYWEPRCPRCAREIAVIEARFAAETARFLEEINTPSPHDELILHSLGVTA